MQDPSRTRHARVVVIASVMLAAAALAPAQVVGPPRLVADVNVDSPVTDGSWPGAFATLGTHVYFPAGDWDHGHELWRTDGTVAGTHRVLDLQPGPGSGTGSSSLVASGGRLWFTGATAPHDHEVFVSDGTPAGTRRVADIGPGADGAFPYDLASGLGSVWFGATDGDPGATGYELWRTDGTAAGTHRVVDLFPGPSPSYSLDAIEVGGRMVFWGDDGVHGAEPHATGGSAADTVLLADIAPGAAWSWDDDAARALSGGRLFFAALLPNGTRELWVTDGTPAGTALVFDPPTGRIDAVLDMGGQVALVSGPDLWVSDGTPAGTRRVHDPAGPWAPTVHGGQACVLPGRIVFAATSAAQRADLWVTDGTDAGTLPIADLTSGAANVADLTCDAATGRAFFSRLGSASTLWVTDTTAAGTIQLGAVRGTGFHFALGRAFFEGHEASTVLPWVSDGTPAGTFPLVRSSLVASSSDPTFLTAVEGLVAGSFRVSSTDGGAIHLTDGTAAGTRRVGDGLQGPVAVPGTLSPGTTMMLGLDGTRLLLSAYSRDTRRFGGWVVDVRSGDATLEFPWGIGYSARRVGRKLFLGLDPTGSTGIEPHLWDGVAATQVAELASGRSGSGVYVLGTAGGEAVFAATTPDAGDEPCVTVDQAATSRVLADLVPGTEGSYVGWGRQLGDRVVFGTVASGGWPSPAGPGLWVADGAGVTRLTTAEPFYAVDEPMGGFLQEAAELPGPRLVLSLWHSATGWEPWTTDGTPAGTRPVEIRPGPESSMPQHFESLGDRVLFAADDGSAGNEPWITDGTAAGTVRLVDLVPGPISSSPAGFRALGGGRAVFSAWTPDRGREAWITDGTAAGTSPLEEVVPGPGSSSPDGFTPAGRRVVFAARSPEGREPWAYELAWAPEQGNCLNLADDDGDGAVDCLDPDCAASDACVPLQPDDADGDGVGDSADCAPADAGSHHVPAEPILHVRRAGPSGAVVSWTDLAPQAGSAVTHDVARGRLADLPARATAPCAAVAVAGTAWTDAAAPADAWYLVRGRNACGPPSGAGWGTDSLGRERPGCP